MQYISSKTKTDAMGRCGIKQTRSLVNRAGKTTWGSRAVDGFAEETV